MSEYRPQLTVGITTRDRCNVLLRCVDSLRLLSPLDFELIVVDDASDRPVGERIKEDVGVDFPARVELIRKDVAGGYIAARNQIARRARADFILTLDDDAFLLEGGGVRAALNASCVSRKQTLLATRSTSYPIRVV